MTLDLDNMTQSEFDNRITEIKDRNPNLFQFIIDFLDDKVTPEEVYDFLKMKRSYQVNYIKNYKARA
nr:MAG TPA: Mitochondrial ribosomal protein subunit [Caudoviricetes sp.]